MIQAFLDRAQQDQPVYLHEVREAFQKEGTRPFHCHAVLLGGAVRSFPLTLPSFAEGEQRRFVESYLQAILYNILVSLGAVRMELYVDPQDTVLQEIAEAMNEVFQVRLPKAQRRGYGRCLNVIERMNANLASGDARFAFHVLDLGQEPEVPAAEPVQSGGTVFGQVVKTAESTVSLGVDIGGTDIKLAVAVNGQLRLMKEYDWFPAGFDRAEQLTQPVERLVRLMRAAASLVWLGKPELVAKAAMGKEASQEEIEEATREMEAAAGAGLRGFDSLGLCFPDVVIQNKIVGGETYKTRGMRNNSALDYEAQFQKITVLEDRLRPFVREGGAVMLTNDGPMAAFTTAVEQAAIGQDVSAGFFAHTLGTELGTGWVRPDGSIPDIPLEVYNFIIDLGSFSQKVYDADDVRSINNFNTDLPGTLQKYPCQSGVFRLAAKYLPEEAPEVYRELLEKGLFAWQGDKLLVPTQGKDMRKPCLEYLMARTADVEICREIFRWIGEYMGATYLETEYILRPETQERTLFGRLVKNPTCFALMNEGAQRIVPTLRQYAADDSLANTPLMKQLAQDQEYTVAQFAQAVGAVYYGCMGITG